MDAPVDPAVVPRHRNTAAPGAEMRMIIHTKIKIADAITVGYDSEKTAHIYSFPNLFR
jgi:hypothetical protein